MKLKINNRHYLNTNKQIQLYDWLRIASYIIIYYIAIMIDNACLHVAVFYVNEVEVILLSKKFRFHSCGHALEIYRIT